MNLDPFLIARYDEFEVAAGSPRHSTNDPASKDPDVQQAKRTEAADPTAHVSSRRAASSLDFVLVLAVIFAMAALLIPMSRHAITVVYEIICSLVAWPFV